MEVVDDEAELAPTLVQLLQGEVGHQQPAQHEEGVNRGQRVQHRSEGKAQTAGLNAQRLEGVADGEILAEEEKAVAQQDPAHADKPDAIEDVEVVRAVGLLGGHDGGEVGVEGEGEAEFERE